jgi:hypothetical protein
MRPAVPPSRALLGPGLLIVLAVLLGVAAVCVRQGPPEPPVVVAPSTLVIVAPASPSPTVYQFPTMTPLPERLPAPATPSVLPAVFILDTPEPTATPPPMLVLPTPTNTRVTVQRG